jgi:Flp pilus assembly protein TadG
VALCLVPIIGMGVLVFDVGLLRDERRCPVVAADAAALAAVTDLYTNWNKNAGVDKGSAVESAKTTAAANGFPNSGNSTVTVNVYPSNYQQGPHAGTQIPKGYAEVIITFTQPRYFGNIWGNQTLGGGVRAVAAEPTPPPRSASRSPIRAACRAATSSSTATGRAASV